MKLLRMKRTLSFNIISAIVFLLVFSSVLLSVIGYINFTNSLTREYTDMCYRTACTATTLVDGDRIDAYLSNGEDDPAYALAQKRMDVLCSQMDVTLIYVIRVNTADYNSFVSVFNSVNEKNDRYTRWEAGYFRETTNETYRQIYKDIYENDLAYGTTFRTSNLNGAEPHLTVLVPVKNSDGVVTAILCVQRPMNELIDGRVPYVKTVIAATFLLCTIFSILAAVFTRKHIAQPLQKVTEEARRFAQETSAPSEPLPNDLSNVREIASLASSVNTMETDMLHYMENLKTVTGEKERIGTELNIASQIQEASVPSLFPAFPDRKEFDIFATMTPAKEVGGDFYDFFLSDDDHLALIIADVSGKGVPAALFMMVTKILISDHTIMGGSPGKILSFVNDRICESNKADMFVTVWLGILEISTGKVIAASAGHDDPAICRKGGQFELYKQKHGLVIGAMSGARYREYEFHLEEGDKLFLYTDGLPEATDAQNRMLGIDGMLKALNEYREYKPKEIASGVWTHVQRFVNGAPQFDDLTMLCLEMKAMKNDTETLKVEAKTEKLEQVNEFIDTFLETRGCSMKAQMQIDLCVEEIFVNIANYAYPNKDGTAEIQIFSEDDSVTLTFLDSGTPYNPLEKADPDITLSAEQRQIGGLGIFLVKKNMDDVQYRFENGKNRLTLTKKIK